MTQPRLVVAGVIRDGAGRILAARRVPAPQLAPDQRWEFPGGKVEPGESPEQALARELIEELSLPVRVGDQLLGPLAGDWPIHDRLVLRVFWCTTTATPRLGSDHDQLSWLEPGELPGLGWLPADVAVAEQIASGSG